MDTPQPLPLPLLKEKSVSPILRDPELIALLKDHFWCDFSDVFPSLSWEEKPAKKN